MSASTEQLASVLGRVPSGLFIVTAQNSAGDATGMLASWVQQGGFEPPSVTIAVKSDRYLNDWLKETSRVAVTILGESQKNLLGHFSKGFEPSEDAFVGLETSQTSDGIPVLTDAIGWLAGEVTASADAGDHTIYVVRLTEADRGARFDNEQPRVHIRKNGLGY